MNTLQLVLSVYWLGAAFFWTALALQAFVQNLLQRKVAYAFLTLLSDCIILGTSGAALFLYDGSPL